MIQNGKVTLADLLLMFLYLEVLTMVGLYYNSGKLPVRFPLCIAMIAFARYLTLDIKDLDVGRMLAGSGSALLITLAVLVIRYGHVRFPTSKMPCDRAVGRSGICKTNDTNTRPAGAALRTPPHFFLIQEQSCQATRRPSPTVPPPLRF